MDAQGTEHKCVAIDGETILSIANAYKLGLEGRGFDFLDIYSFFPAPAYHGLTLLSLSHFEGACQGDCACSTCHVIATSDLDYEAMGSPSEREEDMLDLAFGLTSRSRLGCQVRVSEALNNIELKIPGTAKT